MIIEKGATEKQTVGPNYLIFMRRPLSLDATAVFSHVSAGRLPSPIHQDGVDYKQDKSHFVHAITSRIRFPLEIERMIYSKQRILFALPSGDKGPGQPPTVFGSTNSYYS